MAAVLESQFCPVDCMNDIVKETILGAFRQLLRPLVRILLRHGVSYGEFAETTKTVFVEVAEKDFRLPGQRQTQSRIAIITGLTRKEVGRITDFIAKKESPDNTNLNRVGRVLGGWHQDPDFTGPYGLPLELAFDNTTNSFSQLVKRYSGDMPPRAMLDELRRVGAVSLLSEGKIRVLTRSYIPSQADTASIQFMGVALRDLAETLDLNLNDQVGDGFFERRVWTPVGISAREVSHFDRLVTDKGQEFLETLDNWLTGKESEAEQIEEAEKVKVGVGIYMFSDANRSFKED